MNILGLSAFVHDSAACLITNGSVIANIEEERLNREKHTSKFPVNSIKYILDRGSLDISQIDVIAFNWDPYLALRAELFKLIFVFPYYMMMMFYSKPPKHFLTILATFRIRHYIKKYFKHNFKGKIVWVPHHLAHAASTYYLSTFDNADILVVDGHGENCSTTMFCAQGNSITRIWKVSVMNSLGILYSNFTYFLGFGKYQEGKVMALASFGKKKADVNFDKIITHTNDGKYYLDSRFLGWWNYKSKKFQKQFGKLRGHNEQLTQQHFDIALHMQEKIKETILHIIKHQSLKSKIKKLCLAGGIFLNCDINRAIYNSGYYEEYFIPPFTSDTGGAIGAALYASNADSFNKQENKFSPFCGPEYSDDQIENILNKNAVRFRKTGNPSFEAAAALAEHKIIAWFQGRVEAGPRALGNRSILANPCNDKIQDTLNRKVKKRESFRPFAPVTTETAALKYFDLTAEIPEIARYMLLTTLVRDAYRKVLPGITHVDGSARIQVVRKEWSPLLHDLLIEFEKLTGHAVLINTSFNLQEPIVCSPEDAIRTFNKTGIDMLVMGNYIVEK